METTLIAVKPEHHRSSGFTLLELVIALAIIAVLALAALPSYETQLIQSRRSDATTALTTFAQKMERYALENGSYSDATTDLYQSASNQSYYNLSVTSTSNSYTLTATPTGIQADDNECGNFTLDDLGTRGISGTATVEQCW